MLLKGISMRISIASLTVTIFAVCSPLMAQIAPSVGNPRLQQASLSSTANAKTPNRTRAKIGPPKPFSVVAFGGGVSSMGINVETATNVNRFMNLRTTGNYLNYTVNNLSTDGLNLTGKINFATAGASLDFYPSPYHGFRVSPGVLFRNNNHVTAIVGATNGTPFTLNGVTYYSSPSAPVVGNASLALNARKTAFTGTVGWGNLIPRYGGGHLSFPFEIGAALVGQPIASMTLTSGQVCTNPAGTVGCMNVVGNATVTTNLQAQVAKFQKDVQPFQYYPIFSLGVGYNFHVRK